MGGLHSARVRLPALLRRRLVEKAVAPRTFVSGIRRVAVAAGRGSRASRARPSIGPSWASPSTRKSSPTRPRRPSSAGRSGTTSTAPLRPGASTAAAPGPIQTAIGWRRRKRPLASTRASSWASGVSRPTSADLADLTTSSVPWPASPTSASATITSATNCFRRSSFSRRATSSRGRCGARGRERWDRRSSCRRASSFMRSISRITAGATSGRANPTRSARPPTFLPNTVGRRTFPGASRSGCLPVTR